MPALTVTSKFNPLHPHKNIAVPECIGFAWQGFGGGGGYRGGFCEKLLEVSLMSDRANASRLQDGPTAGQGRAEPMSDGGSASVITYLRKAKEVTGEWQLQPERDE